MSDLKVKNLLENNISFLYTLQAKGIKNISNALDYTVIYQTYELFKSIPNKTQRKEEVAARCKVSVRTVEQALCLLSQPIEK